MFCDYYKFRISLSFLHKLSRAPGHGCTNSLKKKEEKKKEEEEGSLSGLQAASFGKSFLSDYKSDEFVKVCQELRVLNGVRVHKVGIPLSYSQYPC